MIICAIQFSKGKWMSQAVKNVIHATLMKWWACILGLVYPLLLMMGLVDWCYWSRSYFDLLESTGVTSRRYVYTQAYWQAWVNLMLIDATASIVDSRGGEEGKWVHLLFLFLFMLLLPRSWIDLDPKFGSCGGCAFHAHNWSIDRRLTDQNNDRVTNA